jgi:hypothetical protein
MANELVKTGQRMYELAAKLEAEQRAERAARPAPPSPSVSPLRYAAAPPVVVPPAVFLEWGFCAVRDRAFYTRIERQASGLYLRVGCFRDEGGENYAGLGDSRVLRLDQIRGHMGPCPWCGDDRGQFECDCGIVCGGRVDQRRKWFRCRDSCGQVWEIGEPATKTRVSEEGRRGGQWKKPGDAAMWKAAASSDASRLLLPPARRK